MPYIPQNQKESFAIMLGSSRVLHFPSNAGQLNYVITLLIRNYFDTHQNYQGINDIVGALEGSKLEFTRRITNQYEDSKINLNGDVY